MGGKKTATAAVPAATPEPKQNPVEDAIVAEARRQIEQGKSRIKEAKAIGKVIAGINKLGEWGLAQAQTAMETRRTELGLTT